jgi:hypothetical protein
LFRKIGEDPEVREDGNAGNYAVIEVDKNGKVSVECRLLKRNYQKWNVIGDRPTWAGPMGGDLIPTALKNDRCP